MIHFYHWRDISCLILDGYVVQFVISSIFIARNGGDNICLQYWNIQGNKNESQVQAVAEDSYDTKWSSATFTLQGK